MRERERKKERERGERRVRYIGSGERMRNNDRRLGIFCDW